MNDLAIPRGLHRDRKYLDLAHFMPCMLQIPGVCQSGVHSSVPAHSNLQRHGRGHGSKAHDCYSVAACVACHAWLDTGPASREEKDEAFMRGLERHLLYVWRFGLVGVKR